MTAARDPTYLPRRGCCPRMWARGDAKSTIHRAGKPRDGAAEQPANLGTVRSCGLFLFSTWFVVWRLVGLSVVGSSLKAWQGLWRSRSVAPRCPQRRRCLPVCVSRCSRWETPSWGRSPTRNDRTRQGFLPALKDRVSTPDHRWSSPTARRQRRAYRRTRNARRVTGRICRKNAVLGTRGRAKPARVAQNPRGVTRNSFSLRGLRARGRVALSQAVS